VISANIGFAFTDTSALSFLIKRADACRKWESDSDNGKLKKYVWQPTNQPNPNY